MAYTITTDDVLNRVSTLLQDVERIRWTKEMLSGFFNDGQKEIVRIKPDANVIEGTAQLAKGVIQSLPEGGVQLFDVVSNIDDSGNQGKTVRLVDKRHMDSENPGWPLDPPSSTVTHYMFNEVNPRKFYVYPPQPETDRGLLSIVYYAVPADVAPVSGDDNPSYTDSSLDPVYMNPLIDFIMSRAYAIDADFAANASLGRYYYNNFLSALKTADLREKSEDPNILNPVKSQSLIM